MTTIYKLRCVVTEEVYIGCTSGKLGKRMREHRCLLNKKKHTARKLQTLWDEHGAEGFRLEVVESLPKDCDVIDKRKAEIHWMEFYESKGLLLNISKASFQPPEGALQKANEKIRKYGKKKPSPESNEKRRLAQLGKPKGHGHKISSTKKALGQRPSLETASMGGKAACKVRWGDKHAMR